MEIILHSAGKRFYREWIFRGLSHTFPSNGRTVLLGPNGSGKSTLLQVISGAVLVTEGKVTFHANGSEIPGEEVYSRVSIAAPYLELIEEFTLQELVQLHFQFKRTLPSVSVDQVIPVIGLERSANKVFKFFSSGMKQRVKLALALLSDTSLVLLDEPCSNLDREGIRWYKELVETYGGGRQLIVCSNSQEDEYSFCDRQLNITDFKPAVK